MLLGLEGALEGTGRLRRVGVLESASEGDVGLDDEGDTRDGEDGKDDNSGDERGDDEEEEMGVDVIDPRRAESLPDKGEWASSAGDNRMRVLFSVVTTPCA